MQVIQSWTTVYLSTDHDVRVEWEPPSNFVVVYDHDCDVRSVPLNQDSVHDVVYALLEELERRTEDADRQRLLEIFEHEDERRDERNQAKLDAVAHLAATGLEEAIGEDCDYCERNGHTFAACPARDDSYPGELLDDE